MIHALLVSQCTERFLRKVHGIFDIERSIGCTGENTWPLQEHFDNYPCDAMTNAAQTEAWISEYLSPRYPELIPLYRDALIHYERAIRSGSLTNDALGILVKYAQDPRAVLSENVSSLLGMLADHNDAAKTALKDLAKHARAQVRINSLVALESHQLSALHEIILRGALHDRSARVRELAADKAMTFGLRQLLPDIEAAIVMESDVKLRTLLELDRDLLRDGYRFQRSEDGRISITVRKARGVASMSCTDSEFAAKGLNALIRELERTSGAG